MNILLAGCGDIAQRIPSKLAGKHAFFGLSRSHKSLNNAITPVQGDLNDAPFLTRVFEQKFDVVIATLTPDTMSEQGYQKAYIDTSNALVKAISSAVYKPKLIIWVSSTSVYGQNQGAWVNEEAPANPKTYSGQALLTAEQNILNCEIDSLVIRFSGIYGPGRTRMLDQVLAGIGSAKDPKQWSNRIHSEDCAGVIAHLLEAHQQQKPLLPVYVATDCEPVPLYDVSEWLAKKLGVSLTERPASSRSVRRCSNKKLLDSGYQFQYPSFREGYTQLLQQLNLP